VAAHHAGERSGRTRGPQTPRYGVAGRVECAGAVDDSPARLRLQIAEMSDHGVPLGSRAPRVERARSTAAVPARSWLEASAAFTAHIQLEEQTHVASIIVVADPDAGDASGFLFKSA
jgi:hypothetical protein